MLRTTTVVVGLAALAAGLTITFTSSAATPQVRLTFQGLDAIGWHNAAVRWRLVAQKREKDLDWLQARLTLRVLQVKALQKVKAAPARDVQYAIHLAATTFGVSETDMHSVASCESGHSSTASNGQYRGVFQEGSMFERGIYGRAGFSVWDAIPNAMTAAWTVAREGWSQWSCRP